MSDSSRSFHSTDLSAAVCLLALVFLLLCSPQRALAQFKNTYFDKTGEIQISVADGVFGQHSERFDLIVTENGAVKNYELVFGENVPLTKIPSGTVARVVGFESISADGTPIISVDEFEPFYVGEENALGVTGNRKALAVRVTFTDGAPTASAADIANLLWDGTHNMNDWFQRASNGMISFPRDENGVGGARVEEVAIAYPKSGCDPFSWATAVDAITRGRGIDLSTYQHIIYFLPATGCGWAGLGYVGCSGTCRAWSNNYGTPEDSTADVITHEEGHNLGLNHSRTDPNNTGTANCEYCDASSFMGYGGIGFRGPSAQNQDQLGWLPSDRSITLTTASTKTLYPTEVNSVAAAPALPTGAVQLIRVPYPDDASRYYLISLRSRIGAYSVDLPDSFNNQISIHWGHLSDTYTYLITTLAPGQTYSFGSVSITHLSNNGTSSSVQVSLGAAPTATPTVAATATSIPAPTATATPQLPPATATPTRTPGRTATGTPSPTASPVPPSSTPNPPLDGGNPAPPEPTPPADGSSPPDESPPALQIVSFLVKGFTGNGVILLSSESGEKFSLAVRNGRSIGLLEPGIYRAFAYRANTRGQAIGKRRYLGRINVVEAIEATQLFKLRLR